MEDNDSAQMVASGASLSTLPEELILHIFSFLSQEDLMFGVRATCLHFYKLSLNPDFWKRITVTRPVLNKHEGSCHCKEIFHRNLLQQECIMSNGIDTLPVTSVIRSVEERGEICPRYSVTGTTHYPNLERLALFRKDLPSGEVLVKHQGLRHLELRMSLTLDDLQNSEAQPVVNLFDSLKSLTNLETLALRFHPLKWSRNRSSTSEIQASMKNYFLTGPRLRHIELNCFLNDEMLKEVLDNCLQLKGLEMIYCPELTPDAFCTAVLGKHQLLLSTLTICNCQKLNDTCLKALSVAFPNIKSLTLSVTNKMTNDGLGLVLEACSQLTSLKLTSSKGHKMLGGKTSENLRCLSLHGIAFPSASAFQELCRYSQNMCVISLSSTNIGNTELIILAKSCCLLEEVALTNCHGVDSTGAAYLMKNLPCLRKFSYCFQPFPHLLFPLEQLSPSRKSTQTGVVLENQASLTKERLCSVELSPCQELTAVGVSALAVLCPNLRDLQIWTTSGVNDHIVGEILRNLPNLGSLSLESRSQNSQKNKLTGACFSHVERWGTRLQVLKLVTRYRSFSIDSLVRLLAHSILVECVVPCHTERSPNIPSSEMIRMVNDQHDQLHHQGKRCETTVTCNMRMVNDQHDQLHQGKRCETTVTCNIGRVSMKFLTIRVFRC